jgi:glutathione S-transferase
MLTLYDAARCPFAARARLVLAEKNLPYEPVEIDLDDRPAWLYEKNSTGRVPVLDDDGFVLAESRVIAEYLEERFPETPLMPADLGARALVRLAIERFDAVSDPYYDYRSDRSAEAEERLHKALAGLDATLERYAYVAGPEYSLADVMYVPWLLRAESLGVDVRRHPALADWLDRVGERPAVRAEIDLLAATPV